MLSFLPPTCCRPKHVKPQKHCRTLMEAVTLSESQCKSDLTASAVVYRSAKWRQQSLKLLQRQLQPTPLCTQSQLHHHHQTSTCRSAHFPKTCCCVNTCFLVVPVLTDSVNGFSHQTADRSPVNGGVESTCWCSAQRHSNTHSGALRQTCQDWKIIAHGPGQCEWALQRTGRHSQRGVSSVILAFLWLEKTSKWWEWDEIWSVNKSNKKTRKSGLNFFTVTKL